jgi:glycosyltransferase involved in cell wall biosynthesis
MPSLFCRSRKTFNFERHIENQNLNKAIASPILILLRALQKGLNFLYIEFFPVLCNRKLLKKYNIQLVHLNNAVFVNHEWIYASKLNRIKCITHQRGMEDSQIPKSTYRCVKLLDGVISVSQAVHAFLKDNKLLSKQNTVIYNAIDIDSYVPKKTKEAIWKELNISNESPIFGIIGNIRQWKGQQIVLEAVKRLLAQFPNCKCLIVGDISSSALDDAYYQSLKKFIRENSLEKNIQFTGFQHDVVSIIHALDILVHASIEPEPFGRVIIEGMVLKKPVIATNLGGPKEIIQNNWNGIVISSKDPESLAQAITKLARDPDLTKAISENALLTVKEKFSIHSHVQSVMTFYDGLLDPSSIVEHEDREKILKRVLPFILSKDDDESKTEAQIHHCQSPGWSSRRYIISKLSGSNPYAHYLYKEYAIHDKTTLEIENYIDNEYEGLHFSQKQFGNTSSHYSPIPFGVSKSEKSILMENIRGSNLLTLTNQDLGKIGISKISQFISSYFFRAGEMLQAFQLGAFQNIEYDPDQYAHKEIFDTGFHALQVLEKTRFPPKVLTDYHSYLAELRKLYNTDVLGPVHWDFRPQNIIIEEETERLVLIDFQLFSKSGNPYRDLATFLLAIISYDFFLFSEKESHCLDASFFKWISKSWLPFQGLFN